MQPFAHRMADAMLAQRGTLFLWVPVMLAVGIGLYFGLKNEPSVRVLAVGGGVGALLILCHTRAGPVLGPIVCALGLIATGIALAGARAQVQAAPVLEFRFYGPVQGRVVGVDRSASGAVRLLLDRVVLSNVDPAKVPERVRVSLHGQDGMPVPRAGAVALMTAHLSGPKGPVEPGGFDFRRHAWFQQLGAVGYTRIPALELDPPGADQRILRVRHWLSDRVQRQLPGETGAFAAAIVTGDRSAMGQDTLQALRDSNLAHLLAISGLHMGLLAGVVFAALRLAACLVPAFALRQPVKSYAAAGALMVAAVYLALSGGNVATERAFIMVAVALCAVMVNRRAISLRAVAIAAVVVLILRPEALLGPGFQMSFAATTALVVVFTGLRDWPLQERLPRWAAPVLAVVLSSAVAGLATAPVGMAHFNQVSRLGLLANILSVPLMGVLVIPAAVLAVCLMPLSLDWIAFRVMGWGLDWILSVALRVAEMPGAVGHVPAPPGAVLPAIALGGLVLILWQGRVRFAGLVPMVAAAGLWVTADRPELLITDDGKLVGAMIQGGRALSRPSGSGFAASVWLENDGDGVSREVASARWEQGTKLERRVQIAGVTLRHLVGKRGVEVFEGCRGAEIIVASAPLDVGAACQVYSPETLKDTGAVALFLRDGALIEDTVARRSGQRLWTLPPEDQ